MEVNGLRDGGQEIDEVGGSPAQKVPSGRGKGGLEAVHLSSRGEDHDSDLEERPEEGLRVCGCGCVSKPFLSLLQVGLVSHDVVDGVLELKDLSLEL